MHILITGGTGLIGKKLCRALLQAGNRVTVLSRHPESIGQKCGDHIIAMASLDEWEQHPPFDAVINLAGAPIVDAAWSAARKQYLWDSRVKFTQALVERMAACTHKPAMLLSGSAVGYYGDHRDSDMPLSESAKAGTDFPARLCAAWETEAMQAQALGVRVCLLRTGLVLSADGGLLRRMLLPFQLGLGAKLGNGRQWMSWIHIDDYVEIVIRLLAKPTAEGPFNMTAPHAVRNAEFTSELAAALRRPAWLVAPATMLKVALGARSMLLLGGQRVAPTRISEMGFSFKYPTLNEALKALL